MYCIIVSDPQNDVTTLCPEFEAMCRLSFTLFLVGMEA